MTSTPARGPRPSSTRQRRRGPAPALAPLAGLFVGAALLAGCGTSSDSDTASEQPVAPAMATTVGAADEALNAGAPGTTFAPPTTVPAPAAFDQNGNPVDQSGAATGDTAASPLGAGGATVAPSAADLGRKLIFTADVQVEVDDVAAASASATDIIIGMGGFLFGQNTEGGAEPSSHLTFKVLPADFNTALSRLGEVGELRNQTVSTDDVTDRVVDLGSRITVAELGVERLRGALATTTDLTDYAEIEQLLLQRESDLEVMRGQLRTLQDQVDLATINLTLTENRLANNIEVVVSAYEGTDSGNGCPGQGGISTPSGEAITVCFDITNLGDQTLTEISLIDTVLGIDADTELIPVFGTIDSLAPGQSALVAYETTPERDLRLRTRVTATPTNGVDPEPTGPSVSAQASYDIATFAPDRDPGFGDGLSAAWQLLTAIWVALMVALGFLLPIVVVALPLAWAARWGLAWLRQRRPAKPQRGINPGGGDGGPPPPPPAPPAPQPVAVGAPAGEPPA